MIDAIHHEVQILKTASRSFYCGEGLNTMTAARVPAVYARGKWWIAPNSNLSWPEYNWARNSVEAIYPPLVESIS